jgi:hypothetical protein
MKKHVTIDLEEFQKLDTLIRDIKRRARELINGKSRDPRTTGEEIYTLADRAEAALMSLTDPFGAVSAG